MKLGIYGGTFDPPHLGHLVVAQEALHQLALDRLLFVPASVPPHKQDRGITDGRIRLEMLRAAVAGVPGFDVSELELERDGPSYTADTLRQLGDAHPGAGLFLVLGADQANELHTWREPDVIHSLARLVVFRRAGEHPEIRAGSGAPPLEIEVPRLDVSSTAIRRRVRDREPIRFLVPDAVRETVEREALYRDE